jgi:4-amino-4-deoxy-L-arabinose transferase-like glycosyltransferase
MGNNHTSAIVVLILSSSLAVLFLGTILMAGVPPVDRDALTHHLAVPKLYLQQGGIREIPTVPFSYYPMNLDLLYMALLWFGNDIAPKYIHLAFGLMTAGLIFGYLRMRLGSWAYGLLGALLFLSLPVIVKLSITVYVDLGLIFFSTAALLRLFTWAESRFRICHLMLSGIAAGLCMGTKYNGLLVVFLLGLCVFVVYLLAPHSAPGSRVGIRFGLRLGQFFRPIGYAAVFSAAALIVFSPWMIRNLAWTGNPVYPLAIGVFGKPALQQADPLDAIPGDGDHATPSGGSSEGLNHFSMRTLVFGEDLTDILLIPLRVFFQGKDDSPQYFDGRLNPYLIVLPVVFLLLSARGRHSAAVVFEAKLMAGFAFVYLLMAFLLTDMRIRYIAPIIPPLVILAVLGVHDLLNRATHLRSRAQRHAATAAVAATMVVCLYFNGAYVVEQFHKVDPISYWSGAVDRDAYIQNRRPEYDIIRYANRHLPGYARILCLFTGNRIYYSDREMLCDVELFRSVIRSGRSPGAVADHFVGLGISHLMIGADIFNRWADTQFDERGQSLLLALFQHHFKGLYNSHGYYLFEIAKG